MGTSTGGDLPPDPFGGFVFDDDFVKGGRHEPSARTRDAISRYGALEAERAFKPAPPKRRRRLARSRRRGPQGPRRLRVNWLVGLAVTAAAVGVTYVLNHNGGSGTSLAPLAVQVASHAPISAAPAANGTNAAAQSSAAEGSVSGIDPTTKVGTCFAFSGDQRNESLRTVDCSEPHQLELVAHETAVGDDQTYPADQYWQGPVAQTCYHDVEDYTGLDRSKWTAGMDWTDFVPRTDGWATGDRDINCLIQTDPSSSRSARRVDRPTTST